MWDYRGALSQVGPSSVAILLGPLSPQLLSDPLKSSAAHHCRWWTSHARAVNVVARFASAARTFDWARRRSEVFRLGCTISKHVPTTPFEPWQ